MTQVFDFIVYSENHQALPDGGYQVVDAPTALIVPENLRCLVTAIPDLAWVRIYDRLYSGGLPYSIGLLPDPSECFYIKYGNSSDQRMLTSSRLLVVHRKTGEIFYQGTANDEG